jgi:hypothetical protein
MPRISLQAIVIGGFADLAFTFAFGIGMGLLLFAGLAARMPIDQVTPAARAATSGTAMTVATGIIGLVGSLVGGVIAGRLARHDELLNGTMSSFLGIGLGIYHILSGHNHDLAMIRALAFLAAPAASFLGGYLSRLQRLRITFSQTSNVSLPTSSQVRP